MADSRGELFGFCPLGGSPTPFGQGLFPSGAHISYMTSVSAVHAEFVCSPSVLFFNGDWTRTKVWGGCMILRVSVEGRGSWLIGKRRFGGDSVVLKIGWVSGSSSSMA